MATRKPKISKRSKKRSSVKDLSAKSASGVKGGATLKDSVAGQLNTTVKF
jgi:hypothetical protein